MTASSASYRVSEDEIDTGGYARDVIVKVLSADRPSAEGPDAQLTRHHES